jgi:predicted DCC family thiol-disulfide oxidoreductase YuxK
MGTEQKQKLWIFYDGLCHLCTAEMRHYRKHPRADRLHFVDITATGFDAKQFGLDPKAVNEVMHVRRADGSIATAVDAFIAIWETLEGYSLVRWLITRRPIRPMVDLAYLAFAKSRPYLPKRRNSDGTCQLPD